LKNIKFLIQSATFFSILVAPTITNATSDPLYYRQWQLQGNGVFSDPDNFSLGVIEVENTRGLGEENILMLIAQGMKTDHEDLRGAFWINTEEVPGDGIDNDGNGYVDDIHGINTQTKNGDLSDENGWGTNVAGIIGATVDNGLGIRGIAPNTKIVGCKVDENFNSYGSEQQIAVFDECIDYAISLKQKSANIFAISGSWFNQPILYSPDVENGLKLQLKLVEKLEQHDLLWINGVPDAPETFDNFLLDYKSSFPLGLHSPNVIAATRLDRTLSTTSNFGKASTTSVVAEDILTTTPFDKLYSNGVYIMEVTPEDDRVDTSADIDLIQHPDDPQALAWHIPISSNNSVLSEIILPKIDMSQLSTSALMIDVSLKRNRRLNGYNSYGNPFYREIGSILIDFRVDDSTNWQTFYSSRLSSRGIWDLFAAELDLDRNFAESILADSKVQFRLQFKGDETYIDGFKVWAIEDGTWQNGYDYAYPPNAAQAILSGLAGIIKSHNNDWPAWKIANAITAGGSFNEFVASHNYVHNTSGVNILTLSNESEGALDCHNQLVQRRLLPAYNNAVYMVINDLLSIKTKSINCEKPGDAFAYVDEQSGVVIEAVDDGNGLDKYEDDGLGVLTYVATNVGQTKLLNEYDDDLPVFIFHEYLPIQEIATSWTDTTEAITTSWYSINEKIRLGGLVTDVTQQLSNNPQGHWGIVSLLTVNFDVGSEKNESQIINKQAKKSVASAKANSLPQEFSIASFDPDIFVEKTLNNFRIYAAPKNTVSPSFTRLKAQGNEGERQLIAEFSEERGDQNQGVPFIQIVFHDKKSVIQFNYGDLPEYLEGVEYDIGIEIGRSFRQRKTVVLQSDKSYLFDVDSDFDGMIDVNDLDDDNDMVVDELDDFPYDSKEDTDSDGDAIGNNADTDDDNDGVTDDQDIFPLDPNESIDTDNDGIGNNADTDDDNDGVSDVQDAFPLDQNESIDTDKDGIGNNTDIDDDNDGVSDDQDAFSLDPKESIDTDNDGIGNNADIDDDNDGVSDVQDAFPLDPTKSVNSTASTNQPAVSNESSGGGSMSSLMLLLTALVVFSRAKYYRQSLHLGRSD
jgi:hypothetical protein